MSKVSMVLFALIVMVLLSACGSDNAWLNSEHPIQQAEKMLIRNDTSGQSEPSNYSAMEKQVRDFAGYACLESQAEFTGKQYICPKSREACEQSFSGNGQIFIDDYGFVKCLDVRSNGVSGDLDQFAKIVLPLILGLFALRILIGLLAWIGVSLGSKFIKPAPIDPQKGVLSRGNNVAPGYAHRTRNW